MYNTFYVGIVYRYPFIYYYYISPALSIKKRRRKTYYLHNHALFFKINKDKFVGGGRGAAFVFLGIMPSFLLE